MDRFNFNPQNGFLDVSTFSNPQNENEVRAQLQSLHTQTQTFINSTLKPIVDGLESNEISTLQSSDGSIEITKSNKTVNIKVSSQGVTGVTKAYVDEKDGETLASSKMYTDGINASLSQRITTNSDNITTANNNISSINTRLSGHSIVECTVSEYNAINPHVSTTIYFKKAG